VIKHQIVILCCDRTILYGQQPLRTLFNVDILIALGTNIEKICIYVFLFLSSLMFNFISFSSKFNNMVWSFKCHQTINIL